MEFTDYEVSLAHSMIAIAPFVGALEDPLPAFTCYWAAFNNIYVTIAERTGKRPELRKNPDRSIRMRAVGPLRIPEVKAIPERDLMSVTYAYFPDALKDALVAHPNTRFFAHRTPRYQGRPMETDRNGQRLNGVLNVGATLDASHPVWSPIDVHTLDEYGDGARDAGRRDALAKQILQMLYTVRNNTFHGRNRPDDANDPDVLRRALPLLRMIVESFMQNRAATWRGRARGSLSSDVIRRGFRSNWNVR